MATKLTYGIATWILLLPLFAQTFEAVSIRRNLSGGEASDTNSYPGRLTWINTTTLSLVRRAFGVQDAQIIAASGWLTSERFDILAVTGQPTQLTDAARQPFLQSMLADRFQLKFHRETRELRTYVLVVGKNGPKLRPYSGVGEYAMTVEAAPGKTILRSTKGNIDRLVEILSRLTGRAVVNDTGLSGEYDFTLQWIPDQDLEAEGASLFTALQEQIGLKLESTKRPTEVLVIDRIERPSEN